MPVPSSFRHHRTLKRLPPFFSLNRFAYSGSIGPALLTLSLLGGVFVASVLSIPMAEAGTGLKTSAKPASQKLAPPKTPEKTDESLLPPGAIEYNKGVELFQIAQVQSEKGNTGGQKQLLKEAIRHFDEALKQNPALVDAQSNIGFAYLTLRDYRKAIGAFEKALAINPQHLNTLNGLATAYAFHNETDRSIKTFDRLTTLDPGNSQYFFNKGSVLQRARRVDEARKAYEQALRISPEDQRALFNMGTLYENQGKLAEARSFYEKAKGVEIGNTIGLEAIHRLEAIDAALNNSDNNPAPSEGGKSEQKRGKQSAPASRH